MTSTMDKGSFGEIWAVLGRFWGQGGILLSGCPLSIRIAGGR